jgi:H+-transporting ATPase
MNNTKPSKPVPKSGAAPAAPAASRRTPAEVAKELGTDLAQGLAADEVTARQARYGANALAEKTVSPLERLLRFFWGPIPWMIEAAAVLSLVLGDWSDFAIILTMLIVNAAVGWWQESKADNAIAVLKQRLAPTARALRGGQWSSIAAAGLVPGDVVSLRLGNIVPADVVLAQGDYLSTDESALTGESLPVEKKVGDAGYSGSIVKLGEMTAIVTAIGNQTFFGRTAQLVAGAQQRSHFQRAVMRIGDFLIFSTLALVSLIIVLALFRHDPFLQTLKFALILTVAAIPVALPAVLSVTMAVGAERLAKLKAIVSRLVAIEELAGVDVLCADKTGTLTQNKLTVGEPLPLQGIAADDLLAAAALASNRNDPDAIDAAVLAKAGESSAAAGYEVVKFTPFDPVHKRTDVEVRREGRTLHMAKGAPQVIVDLAKPDAAARAAIDKQVEQLASRGDRAIAVARTGEDGAWRLLGLLSIFDPPREDSAATIKTANDMGVRVKMITGDHEAIARKIGGELGLGTNMLSAQDVFASGDGDVASRVEAASGVARVFPEHKFRIVKALQEQGKHIVGMTGDGVNDAPALKQADVGIAVSGATDAARAAADLVLTAPGLSVITLAIEEARRIFERMTSYATFRIAETIRVLLFMTLSIVVFNFYPVTAVMIVLLAILNDFPIMMIAYDNVPVARAPVRWNMHRVLTVASVLGVLGLVSSFLLFWFVDDVLKLPREMTQSIIFLKLLIAGHLTIYVTRSQGWFWSRPWPSLKLFGTCEATQVLGTLVAVYGVFMQPIGWGYALAVWAYALAWLPIASAVAVAVRRLVDRSSKSDTRHLARIEQHVHGA